MRLLLDKKDFFAHLSARGFTYLFHANSVETGLSFFSINHLGSRGFLEGAKLQQSEQYTDLTDKKFGVWDDLFLNFHDHHRRFNRPNAFGPLSFRIPLSEIKNVLMATDSTLSVCRKNAEKWLDEDLPGERWIKDMSELANLFAEPIAAGERRGFFKDGVFPDIVIGKLGSLSLNLVDKVVVEQNPSWPGHFDTLKLLVEEVWPKAYRRPEIVVRRQFCAPYCACKKTEMFDAKIQNLFSFNRWQEQFPQHFPRKKEKR